MPDGFTPTTHASFVVQFQREVHESYVRTGSKLRNTVRIRNNVQGAETTFIHKLGAVHETCFLQDLDAGDWVGKLDELKTNVTERQILANAGAYALGRQTDVLVIQQLDRSTNVAGDATDGLTKAKVLKAFEMLGAADVPDDGQRYAVVGCKQWSQLLGIDAFADAPFVSTDEFPWGVAQAKRWLGTMWMPHSCLTRAEDGGWRACHWYHKTAVGHASGSDVTTDITWHGDRRAHFVNHMMSQGACLIDPAGVVTLRCAE